LNEKMKDSKLSSFASNIYAKIPSSVVNWEISNPLEASHKEALVASPFHPWAVVVGEEHILLLLPFLALVVLAKQAVATGHTYSEEH
jgi:hypothetical protein